MSPAKRKSSKSGPPSIKSMPACPTACFHFRMANSKTAQNNRGLRTQPCRTACDRELVSLTKVTNVPEVWVGARELPPEQQGITLLGTPIGTPEFQTTHLQATADQHSTLLQRIRAIQDLQAEWLLLLYCASPRCNYLLRMLRPEITEPFNQAHDTAITLALAQLLVGNRTPPTTPSRARTHQRLPSQPLRLLGFLG